MNNILLKQLIVLSFLSMATAEASQKFEELTHYTLSLLETIEVNSLLARLENTNKNMSGHMKFEVMIRGRLTNILVSDVCLKQYMQHLLSEAAICQANPLLLVCVERFLKLGTSSDIRVPECSCYFRFGHPLYIAASHDNVEVVRLMLRYKPQINSEVSYPETAQYRYPIQTALHAAAYHGNVGILELLAQEPSIEINKSNDKGQTPFALACSSQNGYDAVRWFLTFE